ncbi:HAMP domain-containing protein [Desulforhopalus vacuolatus]|uniref:sensor histidine kinase n=1 Tax=Desulforhopalus vacuolatus TaxID=40414 RepID=UPI001963B841|nr:ATP-binding protein [Desulforhopalus vacuolatus]MBM9519791.1 HAMP domain-containing protein [Desulforhopalus vacuolatus]
MTAQLDDLNLPDLSAANVGRLRQRRKHIRRWIIGFCLMLIPLVTWLEASLFHGEPGGPQDNNSLIFILININVLLALVFLFLVLRNLAEVLFEGRARRFGRKLKTKLIASFLLLSLIPTLLLFFVSMQIIFTSMDYWFDDSVEDSLQKSLTLAQSLLNTGKKQTTQFNQSIGQILRDDGLWDVSGDNTEVILKRIIHYTPDGNLDVIQLEKLNGKGKLKVSSPRMQDTLLPAIPWKILQKVRNGGDSESLVQELKNGFLVSSVTLLNLDPKGTDKALITCSILLDSAQLALMTDISHGVENYRQLKHFKEPIKFWLVVFLLIVTLMVAFAAIWFGLYISRGLTSPLENLVLATQRVAGGDLQFQMPADSNDEMGKLMKSFNLMTDHLNRSNQELAGVHAALQRSSEESEQRRRYTEILLQNVQAGVISIDRDGKITTINRFAENLLNIDSSFFLNHNFTDVLPPSQSEIVIGFIEELSVTGKLTIEKHIKLRVLGKRFSLLINFTRLDNDNGELLGYVLVFDNLTKIEKMQRMAAWREVARRIAHEIKNPLTPIQLSAQRLRRRYPQLIAEQGSILDKCTNTIIDQVDEIKLLVNEFSQFARMPKIEKVEGDIVTLARRTLDLYEEAHHQIHFIFAASNIPIFRFDREQIKRCLINLLDNAVAVLPVGGKISITLSQNDENETLFISVADDGPGIPLENQSRLFEPYFSTKKTGTGLGLAIVSTIIADHNGHILVQDNIPRGTVFIIELPLTAPPSTS